MTNFVRSLERFLFPNACVSCDRPVGASQPDALVCSICLTRVKRLHAGCTRCGQPEPPIGPCRFCADWPPELVWVRSGVWMSDEVRAMIHHLKYGGYPTLADTMALIVARSVPHVPSGTMVPIPVSAQRLRRRGYNQAEGIARSLGNRWGSRVDPSVLHRSVDTVTQTRLPPSERMDNVRNAFVASPPWAPATNGGEDPAIILVDDVLTTGATIVSAAQTLADAGWRRITAVTVARAMPFAVRAGGFA